MNFAVDPVEDPHLHLQHPHSSRGMLRQRSKSSFGKVRGSSPLGEVDSAKTAREGQESIYHYPNQCYSRDSSLITSVAHQLAACLSILSVALTTQRCMSPPCCRHHCEQMYSELSPEDGDADHPSSPVGFMWPSSTKSSAQHLENINITFHPSASQPGLLVNETQDVETGAAESSTGGMGGLSFFKSLSSRRNRSRPRLTVRVDPLTSPVESKEEPTTHLSRTPDIEEVKKKLYAQGFLPRTPKSMRCAWTSLSLRLLRDAR